MMAKKGCREFKVEYASQNVPGQQASGATGELLEELRS